MDTIIFDLGGVILKDKPISVLDNLNINKNDYQELTKFFTNWNDLDLGKISLKDKLDECNFSNNILDKYKDLLLTFYEKRPINMELIDLINSLKKRNYNIYILSDNNKEAYLYYKNHEFFKNIDGWVVSCNYNTVKKDGKLFAILLNKYNLDASKCLFIDDNSNNIDIAKNYGIKGFLFNNDTYEELYKLISEVKDCS